MNVLYAYIYYDLMWYQKLIKIGFLPNDFYILVDHIQKFISRLTCIIFFVRMCRVAQCASVQNQDDILQKLLLDPVYQIH